MPVYKLIQGSAAQGFRNSRNKIRMYGGAFGNGKTTALVADALTVALDYPGCNMMLGRATYANMLKTVYREFFKWCPPNWIKSTNKNEGTCTLVNGSNIDFRYIADQGSGQQETTSNLLSANYDYIGVDQIEDTEITESDFDQMLGRLRGQTEYAGTDTTMPRTGPRFMSLTFNPSLGWMYKRLVKPIHDLRAGRYNPDLICVRDPETNEPVLDELGMPTPLVDLFEATVYENAQNLPPDFISTLEATYTGKMRDRYLLGKWVAFEGVVYDEFDSNIHVVPHSDLMAHIDSMRLQGYELNILEGYDAGVTAPSCYLLALVDADGVIYIIGGFYEANKGVLWEAEQIKAERNLVRPELMHRELGGIMSDPAIFRKSNKGRLIGETVADMFADEGITMQPGNNDILNGIVKVKAYLRKRMSAVNPFTGELGAPMMYISDKLHFIADEMITYRWAKRRDDSTVDKPVDGKDHSLDTIKYMVSKSPEPAKLGRKRSVRRLPPQVTMWTDVPEQRTRNTSHRYA